MINKNGEMITKFEFLNMEKEALQDILIVMNEEEIKAFLKTLTNEEIIKILNTIDIDIASKLIIEIENNEVSKILKMMPFNKSVALINELEDKERNIYLKQNIDFSTKLLNLKSDFLLLHPKDVANKIDEMNNEERKQFFNLFTASELSDFFACLDEEDAAKYLQVLSDNKASDILENMYSSDAVDIINELDEDNKDNYLELMDKDIKNEMKNLCEYDDNEVGSIMHTEYISIEANMDVKEAMKIMVSKAPDVVVINTLFVSEDGLYIGTIDFRKLIVTKSPCKIKDITDINTKYCMVDDNIEYAIKLIDDYDIYALPVLKDGIIEGIVTIDDGFDALQEEREEDYNQLAGLIGEHEEDETVLHKVKRRMPWLAILICLDLIVCLLISVFENVIESLTVLVLFQPIILGLSGNVGMQSLAVCVRSISNSELGTKKAKFKHILYELRNGVVLGLIIATLTFVVGFIFLKITKSGVIDGVDNSLRISIIVSISICISLSLSALFGCLMPIIFNSLHIDPAAASGPFITTLNDVLAITTYFTLATILIGL